MAADTVKAALQAAALALTLAILSSCMSDPVPPWMANAPKVDRENGICGSVQSMLPDYGGRGGGGKR